MKELIQSRIQSSIQLKQIVLQDEIFIAKIQHCVDVLVQMFRNSHKLWICGNGGSAADAQHLAAEFTGKFYKNRSALPAEAMHVNTSYITAVANDYSYDDIYSRLVEGVVQPGDVLIGLSTSGNSKNIVNAFEAARLKNITTIGFTGVSGGAMANLSTHLLNIPSDDTPRIQEVHMLIGHIICELTEKAVFADI
jgi:D-sedoheptulose 7-phosphate isomerase